MSILNSITSLFLKPCQFLNFKVFKCDENDKFKCIVNWLVNALILYGLVGMYFLLAFGKAL